MNEKIEPGTIWERRTEGMLVSKSLVKVERVESGKIYWSAHKRQRLERKQGSVSLKSWRANYDFWGRDV